MDGHIRTPQRALTSRAVLASSTRVCACVPCVRAWVRARMACVLACVLACLRACVLACVHAAYTRACVHVCACIHARVRVRACRLTDGVGSDVERRRHVRLPARPATHPLPRMHGRAHTHTYAPVHACNHAYTHTYMHARIHAHVHARMRAHTCTCKHVRMHARTHEHARNAQARTHTHNGALFTQVSDAELALPVKNASQRCVEACVQACVRACVHGCIHLFVRACVRLSMHACLRACMHACMHACVRASVRVCLRVCVLALFGSAVTCVYAIRRMHMLHAYVVPMYPYDDIPTMVYVTTRAYARVHQYMNSCRAGLCLRATRCDLRCSFGACVRACACARARARLLYGSRALGTGSIMLSAL